MEYKKIVKRFVPLICVVCVLVSLVSVPAQAETVPPPTIPSGDTAVDSTTYPPAEIPFSEPDAWYGVYCKRSNGTYRAYLYIFDWDGKWDLEVTYSNDATYTDIVFYAIDVDGDGYHDDPRDLTVYCYTGGQITSFNLSETGARGKTVDGVVIYQAWGSSDNVYVHPANNDTTGTIGVYPPQFLFGAEGTTYRQFLDTNNTIANSFKVWFSALFTNLSNWFSSVVTAIKDGFADVGEWFTSLFTKLGDWFSTLWGKLDTIIETLTEAGEAAKEAIDQGVADSEQAVGDVENAVGGVGSVEDGYMDSADEALGNLPGDLTQLPDSVTGYNGNFYIVNMILYNPFVAPFLNIACIFLIIRSVFSGKWWKE